MVSGMASAARVAPAATSRETFVGSIGSSPWKIGIADLTALGDAVTGSPSLRVTGALAPGGVT